MASQAVGSDRSLPPKLNSFPRLNTHVPTSTILPCKSPRYGHQMLKAIVRLRWSRSESIPHPVSTFPPLTSGRHPFSTYVPRRLIRLLTAIVFACVLGVFLLRSYVWQESAHLVLLSPDRDETLPPNYHDWYEKEKSLPQHDIALPYPQGREGHYLWIANHATGAPILSQPTHGHSPHIRAQASAGEMSCRRPC